MRKGHGAFVRDLESIVALRDRSRPVARWPYLLFSRNADLGRGFKS